MQSVDVTPQASPSKILENLRKFYIGLDTLDRMYFWSLMAALRGPDTFNAEIFLQKTHWWKRHQRREKIRQRTLLNIKMETTARLRHFFFSGFALASINDDIPAKYTFDEVKKFAGMHFAEHLRAVDHTLIALGSDFRVLKYRKI